MRRSLMVRGASRVVACAVVAGLLTLVIMLVMPFDAHHGDGEQACGSVLRHDRVGGVVPVPRGAPEVTWAVPTDACPPEDYRHQRTEAVVTSLVTTVLGGLAALATGVRRRRLLATAGTRLEAAAL